MSKCVTIIGIDESGHKQYKDKKKFNTLDDAIIEYKRLNAMPDRLFKLVSYKCLICFKYHIGRNGKQIKK